MKTSSWIWNIKNTEHQAYRCHHGFKTFVIGNVAGNVTTGTLDDWPRHILKATYNQLYLVDMHRHNYSMVPKDETGLICRHEETSIVRSNTPPSIISGCHELHVPDEHNWYRRYAKPSYEWMKRSEVVCRNAPSWQMRSTDLSIAHILHLHKIDDAGFVGSNDVNKQ